MARGELQRRLRHFRNNILLSNVYQPLGIRAVFLGMKGTALKAVIQISEASDALNLHDLAQCYFGKNGYVLSRRNEYPKLSATINVGTGIRHPNVMGWGTLGGIFTRANDTHIYGLSNNHVIANFNHANDGDPIFHNIHGEVGKLFNWLTLLDFPQINYIDAALVRLSTQHLPLWNAPRPSSGQWLAPQVGMQVVKRGFATDERYGVIRLVNGEASAGWSGRNYFFSGIIEIEGIDHPFSTGGDSGSVVLSWPDLYMVGIIFATVENFSWALPISGIKPLLG